MKRIRAFRNVFLTSIFVLASLNHSLAGYINLPIYAGNNLVANQLVSGNDTIGNLFSYQIPDDSTFTKWDAASNQYLPISTYNTGSGWNINYSLSLGEGGLLYTPQNFTNTFVGSIWPSWNGQLHPFNTPVTTNTGTLLLSCLLPVSANFFDVVGRNPQNGESVTRLNPITQAYTTTTYMNSTWDNGTPLLNVSEPAFFNLQAVPEPATMGLFGVGIALMLSAAKLRKK